MKFIFYLCLLIKISTTAIFHPEEIQELPDWSYRFLYYTCTLWLTVLLLYVIVVIMATIFQYSLFWYEVLIPATWVAIGVTAVLFVAVCIVECKKL